MLKAGTYVIHILHILLTSESVKPLSVSFVSVLECLLLHSIVIPLHLTPQLHTQTHTNTQPSLCLNPRKDPVVVTPQQNPAILPRMHCSLWSQRDVLVASQEESSCQTKLTVCSSCCMFLSLSLCLITQICSSCRHLKADNKPIYFTVLQPVNGNKI